MNNGKYEKSYYGIHSIDEIIREGAPIIPENHSTRIEKIKKYKMIYAGEREILERYYKNELIKYGVFKENSFNNMMVLPNYCRKHTNNIVDTAISSKPTVVCDNKKQNKAIQNYLKTTDFLTKKLQQIMINTHVTGNCFTRIITNGKENIPQILDTEQVFVLTDIMTNETTGYVVFTGYEETLKTGRKKKKIKILLAEIGKDTIFEADNVGGYMRNVKKISENKTQWPDDFSIVNFVVKPILDFYQYGTPGYEEADALQSNFIKCSNTEIVASDKIALPILTGPSLNEENMGEDEEKVLSFFSPEAAILDGSTRNKIELSGNYVANDSDRDIEYVETKGSLDVLMKLSDKNKKELIMALDGDEMLDETTDVSRIDSAKGYKMFFLRLLNTVDRFTSGIQDDLVELLKRLTKTNENYVISITFHDGLPDFPDERVDYAEKRLNNGTFSIVDAISYIENISIEEAEKRTKEILERKKNFEENQNGGDKNVDKSDIE